MPIRLHPPPFPIRTTLTGCAAILGLASACGGAGEPPSALPSAGASAGGTSGGAAANGGSSNGGSSNGGTTSAGAAGEEGGPDAGDGGDCNPQIFESPPTSAIHETQCVDISYSTTPPSGGQHYGTWAAYQTYDYPLPVGYVVHNLEHGAIVFWYDCPEGCADEIAEVQAFIDGRPEDPLCDGFAHARRTLLVPYPGLGARWAASAWGFALVADCFDSDEFGEFYTAHYGRGPESLCDSGPVIPENACP